MAKERVVRDLEAASVIQHALLPSPRRVVEGLQVSGELIPCGRAAGDSFNWTPLPGEGFGAYMIDVGGVGVPSVMVSVLVSELMRPEQGVTIDEGEGWRPPTQVLQALEEALSLDVYDLFITMVYVVLDRKNCRGWFANAGHPYPVLIPNSAPPRFLEKGGPLLGMSLVNEIEDGTFPWEPGDRLLLFSDGLIDWRSPYRDFFGRGRLLDFLEGNTHLRGSELTRGIIDEARHFSHGLSSHDDVTLFLLENPVTKPQKPARGHP